MIETTKRIVCDRCGAQGPEALESEDPVVLAEAEGWNCGDEEPSASAGIHANYAEGNSLPELPRSDAILPAVAHCCPACAAAKAPASA